MWAAQCTGGSGKKGLGGLTGGAILRWCITSIAATDAIDMQKQVGWLPHAQTLHGINCSHPSCSWISIATPIMQSICAGMITLRPRQYLAFCRASIDSKRALNANSFLSIFLFIEGFKWTKFANLEFIENMRLPTYLSYRNVCFWWFKCIFQPLGIKHLNNFQMILQAMHDCRSKSKKVKSVRKCFE